MPSVAIVDLHGPVPNTALVAIAAHAEACRAEVSIFDAVGGRFPRPRAHDAYLISGGPGMPNDGAPWRVRVQAAIPEWAKSKPVFAIGLGFQLMAQAYGWPVRPASNRRDGVYPVTPSPAGWSDPLMADLENATPVLEQRTWAVLPPPAAPRSGASVLAYTSAGDVAVARFSPKAAGCIFHPEAKTEGAASTVLARFIMDALDQP
jgi:GMP synthase-like glutamine amidotransferase